MIAKKIHLAQKTSPKLDWKHVASKWRRNKKSEQTSALLYYLPNAESKVQFIQYFLQPNNFPVLRQFSKKKNFWFTMHLLIHLMIDIISDQKDAVYDLKVLVSPSFRLTTTCSSFTQLPYFIQSNLPRASGYLWNTGWSSLASAPVFVNTEMCCAPSEAAQFHGAVAPVIVLLTF